MASREIKTEELEAVQRDLSGRIARAWENLRKVGTNNITLGTIQSRLNTLEANWAKFEANHDALIQRATKTRESRYFSDCLFETTEELYLTQRANFLDEMQRAKAADEAEQQSSPASSVASEEGRARTALPRIELPQFSGDYKSWTPFRDLFTSLVRSNKELSPVEKLHYLKTSISGEAYQLIENLSTVGDNFSHAWEILVARYENKRILVEAHVSTLLNLKAMSHDSSAELKMLLGVMQQSLSGLDALGRATTLGEDFIVFFVAQKLDAETRKAWRLQLGNSVEPPTLKQFKEFVIGRIHALEPIDEPNRLRRSRALATATKPAGPLKAHHAATAGKTSRPEQGSQSCSLCGSSHYLSACGAYREKTPDQRREFLIAKKLCYNCLGPHAVRVCRSSKRCQICSGHHHTTIHLVEARRSGECTSISASAAQSAAHLQAANAHHVSATRAPVLLATAVVKALDVHGSSSDVRVLLDQGSEISFIREALVQRLKLPRRHADVSIVGIGNHRSNVTRGVVTLVLRSRTDAGFACEVTAYVLPRLTKHLPPLSPPGQNWPHLQGLELADPGYRNPGTIDIILGADVYGRLLEADIRKGPPSAPVAQRTTFGWIISGPQSEGSPGDRTMASTYHTSVDRELLELVQRFWTQEEPAPHNASSLSPDEQACEQHFVTTHSRNRDGRYIVRLPLKEKVNNLGDSYTQAYSALSRLEKRFQSNAELRRMYSDFLREYEQLGHMQRIQDGSPGTLSIFYLPHHAVLRPTSTTTKLRVVFNGSQRTHLGISLNDRLHIGPKLQSDLADVLLRWRRYKYVFTADIAKMYRQILVHCNDRDFQRILWRDQAGQVISFRLCTVTYGLACAPYLALRVLQQLSKDEGQQFPLGPYIIDKEMYVDDVLSGAHSLITGREKIHQIHELLKAGGFPLQKWRANDPKLLDPRRGVNDLSDSSVPPHKPLDESSETSARALGLAWDPQADNFVLSVTNRFHNSTPTKRSVLSRIAQMFDPLGWLAPVVIQAKIFMQLLWAHNCQWDDPLPDDLCQRWRFFLRALDEVKSFTIPRWLGITSADSSAELHGFSDASQDALAAAVYLRVPSSLVTAKTKVAPLKRLTIPKLELSAAVLLVRLISHVKVTLEIATAPTFLWSDSTVALAWISSHPSRWKDYVRNRVAIIRVTLPDAQWRHVPSRDNPADCASRGLSPQRLAHESLWWHGPDWLGLHKSRWPTAQTPAHSTTDLEARTPSAAAALHAATEPILWDLISRYSRLTRLLRITAWCQRFLNRIHPRKRVRSASETLTPGDLEEARLYWVHTTQHSYFAKEIRDLREGSPISRKSPLLRLAPFLDSREILRVGGRLKHALLDADQKHPAILPRTSALTTLILDDTHRATLHGSTQITLATLRQKYWIVGGRIPVRAFIYRCLPCARHRALASQQLMGQLPRPRVRPARVFENSGVDYAGPIGLKTHRGRGAKPYKGYIVVFVCLAVGAVHLELATDYSSEGFIAAYKRFTSRRGICATLLSDCGTNLIGADAELRRMLDTASAESRIIGDQLANCGTAWKFNPPSAPHFGGKWEAAVKSIKFHLRRVIGDATLTYEEYSTLLTQVEAVLNSRPLCPLSDDPTDTEALTPGHFLIGAALNTVPEGNTRNIPVSRLSRWQLLRNMLERFWHRWSVEYLQHLQLRAKWHSASESIRPGALVLVIDQRYPPSKWPLARVVATFPGSDQRVRVVKVKTATTTLTRPIHKLCVLPVCEEPPKTPV